VHLTLRATLVCLLLATGCARERASPGATQSPAPSAATDPSPNATPPAASQAAASPLPLPPTTPAATPAPTLSQLLPGLRVDAASRTIELDATVAIDASKRVFLEVLVCTPDTREHETILVTKVTPSQVHAAMLAAGLSPGAPGSWRFEGQRLVGVAPTGDAIEVLVRAAGGGDVQAQHATEHAIASWVISARDGTRLSDRPTEGWVFAGSSFGDRGGTRVYRADGEGTLVGLSAFGFETIAWTGMYHPDSAQMTPDWIADGSRVPSRGERVVVVIRGAKR
jgi:hypothetical protein